MKNIFEIEEEIIAELAVLPDWMSRYEYLIELGKQLPSLADADRTEENLVPGCTSRVWIIVQARDGVLTVRGDSDALIVKGLLALVIRLFDGQPVAEVAAAQLTVFEQAGFVGHLSPSRSIGLHAMIQKIQTQATTL